MRRLAWMLGAGLGALACGQSDDRPRYESPEDHCTLVAPVGWTPKREYSSLVFVGPQGDRALTTITIRAIPIEGEWTQPRTPDLVVAATEKVLRGLPAAKLAGREEISAGDFSGVAFDLSFVPDGKRGRYDRRHVVFTVGGRGYIYHIIHTAPAGRLKDSAKVFADVLATLREEV